MKKILAGMLLLLSTNLFAQDYFGGDPFVAFRLESPFALPVNIVLDRESRTVTAITHTFSQFSVCVGEANFDEEAIEYHLGCQGSGRRYSQRIDLSGVTDFDRFEAQVEDSRFEEAFTASFTKEVVEW